MANEMRIKTVKRISFVLLLFLLQRGICLGQLNSWVGGDGLWNDMTNWSQGTVPDANDSVVIVGTPVVTIPGGFNAVAESVFLPFQAQLNIEAMASLSVNGAKEFVFRSLGIVQNDGLLHLDGTGSTGNILITPSLINNDSLILVNIRGLTCTDLTNAGVIEIGKFDGFDIEALRINGSLNNTGSIHIQGTIAGSSDGIQNNDSIVNMGVITIDSLEGSQSNGIDNSGYLHNDGIINISEILGDAYGILNRDTIVNTGKINITNVMATNRSGIVNFEADAHITNSDSICIGNEPGYSASGLEGSAGTCLNGANGVIMTSGINGTGARAVQGGNLFTNDGKILILNQSSATGLSCSGEFNNNDTIDIVGFSGQTGLLTGAQFTNGSTGVIRMEQLNTVGINQNADTLINDGQILIDSSNSIKLIDVTGGVLVNRAIMHFNQDVGPTIGNCIQIGSSGEFVNDANGIIDISNRDFGSGISCQGQMSNHGTIKIRDITADGAGTAGISCSGANGHLTNSGLIEIYKIDGSGISANNADSIINMQSGIIKIDSIGGTFRRSILSTSTDFVNYGMMMLSNNLTTEAINFSGSLVNGGTIIIQDVINNAIFGNGPMTNLTCGRLEVDNTLRFLGLTGAFTNHGTVVQDNSGSNFFNNPSLNTGVISDIQSSFATGNFTNNGIIYNEFAGSFSCTDTILNFYSGSNDSMITTQSHIFSDTTLNTNVGEIQLNDSTIILLPDSEGLDKAYAVFEFSSCDHILPLFFDQPITSCTNTNTWTGSISNDWFTAGNWSENAVPTCFDEVVIPSLSVVIIGVGMIAEALILDVADNADIEVQGEIIIKGN